MMTIRTRVEGWEQSLGTVLFLAFDRPRPDRCLVRGQEEGSGGNFRNKEEISLEITLGFLTLRTILRLNEMLRGETPVEN